MFARFSRFTSHTLKLFLVKEGKHIAGCWLLNSVCQGLPRPHLQTSTIADQQLAACLFLSTYGSNGIGSWHRECQYQAVVYGAVRFGAVLYYILSRSLPYDARGQQRFLLCCLLGGDCCATPPPPGETTCPIPIPSLTSSMHTQSNPPSPHPLCVCCCAHRRCRLTCSTICCARESSSWQDMSTIR